MIISLAPSAYEEPNGAPRMVWPSHDLLSGWAGDLLRTNRVRAFDASGRHRMGA